jgi:hypothetical protein
MPVPTTVSEPRRLTGAALLADENPAGTDECVLVQAHVIVTEACLLVQRETDQLQVPLLEDLEVVGAQIPSLLLENRAGATVTPEVEKVQVLPDPVEEISKLLSIRTLH